MQYADPFYKENASSEHGMAYFDPNLLMVFMCINKAIPYKYICNINYNNVCKM